MISGKRIFRHYLLLIAIALLVIVLDQWSKGLIRQNLTLGQETYPIPFLAPFFRFTYWQNTGAAFGMFQNANIPLLILAVIIAGAVIWYYHRAVNEPLLYRLSLGLILGGALGNMIDRVQLGFVTDFIAVGRFPVFNVADSSVTVGVALMLLGLLLQEHKQKEAHQGDIMHNSGGADEN
ncbi:MAG: signal peptidase II [Anaerolineaceae bacterium]|nr:signal peptidase II [Anaerolineaceae bacterium]